MLPFARKGYTKQEIIDTLHGKYAPVNMRFRYDLLDRTNTKIAQLKNVLDGEVSMKSLATIKRTAKFTIEDREFERTVKDYHLEFDGVDDSANIPFNINVGQTYTYQFNIKLKNGATGTYRKFLERRAPSSDRSPGFWFYSNSNRLHLRQQLEDGSNSGADTSSELVLGEWTNIAFSCSWDGSKTVLTSYVNGIESYKYESPVAPITTTQDISLIGNTGAKYEIGSIKIYNRELSQQEIQDNMNKELTGNEEGLVGYWKFSQGEGSTLYDYSGNNNHGTINGATWDYETKEEVGPINYLTDRIQPFCEVKMPDNNYVEFPLGVFLLSSPTRQDQDNAVIRDVEVYGLTQILKDDKFENRYTVQAGTNYRTAIIDILESAGITKYNIEQTDKTLPTDKDWAPGTDKLKAVNDLLSAINYRPINDDANGYFTSQPYRSPSIRSAGYSYKTDELSVTLPGMSEELDLFSIPNKWVVVLSDPEREPLKAVYTNNNPNSPTSTIQRGRTIVDDRKVMDMADQEALNNYVERIAFEASQIYGKVKFETAIMPFHEAYEILNIEFDNLKLSGKYSETSWTIPLKAGATMKHEVRKVVTI